MITISVRQARIFVAVVTCIAFLNSFGGQFVFDDIFEIALNPAMEQLFPPWEAMFTGGRAPTRPLPYLTFAIDINLWGARPYGFHLTSLLVHVVAALSLFEFTRRTLLSPRLRDRYGDQAVTLAMIIATLWAIHPLQTQSVTYIYQRIESMCGMFCLVSLAAFARAAAAGWPRAWLAGSVAACAAAMASKESAVVLPVMILLYDWLFSLEQSAAAWRADVWRRRRYYAALALSWGILAAVLFSQTGKYQEFGAAKRSAWTYALTQPGVILYYLRLTVWPVGQCLDYSGWPEVKAISFDQLPASCAVLALVIVTAIGVVRRRPEAWLGGMFLLALAPTSSVMPVEAFANEHRMYLALAPVIATLVLTGCQAMEWLARRLPGGPWQTRGPAAVVGLIMLALITLTQMRTMKYASMMAIWTNVLENDPGNYRALSSLAGVMDRAGDEEAAVQLADKALDRKPICHVFCDLAAAHLGKGDYAVAEKLCRHGLQRQLAALPPDNSAVLETTVDLAVALRLQGKIVEADELCAGSIAAMRRVLGDDHTATLSAEQILAEGLSRHGDHAAAEQTARQALARARRAKGPTDAISINATVALGRVLASAGKIEAAQSVIRAALAEVVRLGSKRGSDELLLNDILAEFLETGGRDDEAVAIRRQLTEKTERFYGTGHPLVASAHNKLALSLAALATARGSHALAAEIYSRVFETYTTGLGPDHAETLAVEAKLQSARARAAELVK